MNNELIERIDKRTSEWQLHSITVKLLVDCKSEIEQLRAINASLRSHNEGLDAECARLEQSQKCELLEINDALNEHANDLANQIIKLQARISELEKAREYVPMTDDELEEVVRKWTLSEKTCLV